MKCIILIAVLFAVVAIAFAEPCVQGEMKKIDCNTCFCGPDGELACTRRACPTTLNLKEKRQTQKCVPNSTYKEECNTCHCNPQGTFAACTFRACVPGTY